jgi:hypothetical protein
MPRASEEAGAAWTRPAGFPRTRGEARPPRVTGQRLPLGEDAGGQVVYTADGRSVICNTWIRAGKAPWYLESQNA